MTTKNFYSEYGKQIMLVIIPAIILTGVSSYTGVKVALSEQRKDIQNVRDRLVDHISEFNFYKKKDEIQSEFLHRLEVNQFSLAKDCNLELPYNFKNLNTRGDS